MKKIILLIAATFLLSSNYVLAAGSASSDTESNYDKAVKVINFAKKNEKKGKKEKANSQYEKAQKLLLKSNKEKPGKADPKHKGINEYLGELYVATNRHNLAVERLEVLKGCNCEEYDQLKAVIAGEKSKY